MSTTYTRQQQRFYVSGLSLTPQDALPPDKVAYIRNMRSYQTGTLEPRYGLTAVSSGVLNAAGVHSLFRLDDTTDNAPSPSCRVAGAGGGLYHGSTAVPAAFTQFDNGYSGDPVTGVIAAPAASPEPFLYIGDSARMRKVSVVADNYPIGITQPATTQFEPSAVVGELALTLLDNDSDLVNWTNVGPIGGPVSVETRVDTTADAIIYDSGTTGWACVVPADFANIIAGCRLSITDGAGEVFVVQDVHPAVADGTIAAIIYDSGATGACTIQADISLAVGQLETADYEDVRRRYYDPEPTVPTASKASTIRPIDFSVNALVMLNGTEIVRITSVAVGSDGLVSFRCVTGGAYTAGQSIEGLSSFRGYFRNSHSSGAGLLALVPEQTLNPTTLDDPEVGGMQNIATGAVNAAIVGTASLGFTPHATLPDDDIYLGFKCDLLHFVKEVRIYLNIDATQDFLTNYYMHAWRANDLISAVQSTNAQSTDTIQTARLNVLTQQQVDLLVQQYGPAIATAIVQGSLSLQDYPLAGVSATTPGGSNAIGLTTAAQQLALGNNTWLGLRCKVRDLIRVGQDGTLTLKDINAVQVLIMVEGTKDPITIQIADFYLSGGYGPDVRDIAEPYTYCYRGRSSRTGAIGNPSPPSRTSVVPRRQSVTVTGRQILGAGALGGADDVEDIDRVDWFKRGGLLAGWTYLGTTPNDNPPTYTDTQTDSALDGGESLRFDRFQPWPVADVPHAGTCNVAGTAVSRTDGDAFDTTWAPGTAIIVNGRAATLYASPVSTSLLFVNENLGSASGAAFTVPEPVRLAQPLPALWGGEINSVVFLFACGDPADPGAVHWTDGNDPDSTRDSNQLIVTSASEPLQNGGIWNGQAFTFSPANLYALIPQFGQISTFRHQRTPCEKGLWSRWAMAIAPEGIYFLSDDGIYLTNFGPAVSITTPDLAPLFPHDGALGETIRGMVPPDMTETTLLRLTRVGRWIYFDYRGTDGDDYTLIYDRIGKGWLFDRYDLAGIRARLDEGEIGDSDVAQIMGAADGNLYQYDESSILDGTVPISWAVWTGHLDGDDARSVKQFGDVMLDCHPGATLNGFTITPVADNGLDVLSSVVGAAATTRTQYIVDINNGAGVLSRNIGIRVEGESNECDAHRPLLYLWGPSYLPKAEDTQLRATDWDLAGYNGPKLIRAVTIRANTYNVAKQLYVQYDGGTTAATLTLTANGELSQTFALTPFYATLVRILPADDTPWFVLPGDITWTADPKPALIAETTNWDDAGTPQDKYVQGVVLEVDTNGIAGIQVQVQRDNSEVMATLTLAATTREDGQAFAFDPPFYAHVLRLVPLGAVRLKAWRWIAVPKPELTAQYTDWSDDGYGGAKFMQGLVIHADTGGSPASITVEYDNGASGATFTVPASTGEEGYPFSFAVPFIAHRLRIAPDAPIRILQLRWVWEPTPELADRWETQYTTHDLPGFLTIIDGVVAYVSTATVTWTIQFQDGTTVAYNLASSAGAYRRVRQIIGAAKGKAVRYIWTSAAPFQLYKRDCSVRIVGWGGAMQVVSPFGGPSRADGAAI